MPEYLLILTKFLIPFLLGGLIFFSALVAPNVFSSLDEKNARVFLRGIFPKLYLYSGIFSLFISLILFLSIIFYLLFFYNNYWLLLFQTILDDQNK